MPNQEQNKNTLRRMISRSGFDINQPISGGLSALHYMVSKDFDIDFMEDIFEKFPNLDINVKDSRGASALYYLESEQMFDCLYSKGIDVFSKNNEGNTAFDVLSNIDDLLRINKIYQSLLNINPATDNLEHSFELTGLQQQAILGNKELLLKVKLPNSSKKFFQNEEEVDDFIKLSHAKAIIGLGYSNHEFGISEVSFNHLMHHAANRNGIEKGIINNVLINSIISGEEIETSSSNQVEIIRAPYQDHASYFAIESNKEGDLLHLYCCDGSNNGTKYQNSHLRISLNQEKIKNSDTSNISTKEKLKKTLHNITYREIGNTSVLSDINKLNAAYGRGDLLPSESISSAQERGNCAFKSFNLVLRLIMNKIDPELNFEFDHTKQKPFGKGHDLYKEFKYNLITTHVDDLIDLALNKRNEDKFWYEDLRLTLERVHFHDVRKQLNPEKPIESILFDGGPRPRLKIGVSFAEPVSSSHSPTNDR